MKRHYELSKLLICSLLTAFAFSGEAQNIHRTACSGNLQRLDSMLQHNDLHVPDFRGRSLLHWAVGCRQMEVFKYLVNKGIDINRPDRDGFTPLYVAVQFNNENYLDTLVTLQKDEKWKTQQGGSLIGRAVLNRNLSMVQNLVSRGLAIDVTNERGSTPLEIALRIDDEEIADWLISNGADESRVRKTEMTGLYMGQTSPGLTAQMFAPNFISTEEHEFGAVFNATGDEFYYGVDLGGRPEIRYTQLVDGTWSQPIKLLTHEQYSYNDPFLSPDESRLYFISKRALDGIGDPKDVDIWYVEKEGDGWSQPINAGPNINTPGDEYYISFTNDGTMYYASDAKAREDTARTDHDIYYSKFVNQEFQPAVSLGDSINTEHYEADVFVAPDESYLIFCATRPEGLGFGDLYISFKNTDGSWSRAVNMGDSVNTDLHELCPFVTADGKYLIYTSNGDIYWISAEIIDKFR